MKKIAWAAALLLAGSVPAVATAFTIDADERELYDSSIQCMAFYGVMAGLGSEGVDKDPDLVKSGTRFLAIATVLADDDEVQLKADFDRQMKRLELLTANPEAPDNIKQVEGIVDDCKALDTVLDAMLESGS